MHNTNNLAIPAVSFVCDYFLALIRPRFYTFLSCTEQAKQGDPMKKMKQMMGMEASTAADGKSLR